MHANSDVCFTSWKLAELATLRLGWHWGHRRPGLQPPRGLLHADMQTPGWNPLPRSACRAGDWPSPHETLCTDATESRWDDLTRGSAPPSNIHRKPKVLGSVLQTRCTEKGRLGSQGAYSLGGHQENLTRNGKRQHMASAKIKAERKTRGLKEGYCGRLTQEVTPERVLGDTHMATHLVSHTRIFTILLWTL